MLLIQDLIDTGVQPVDIVNAGIATEIVLACLDKTPSRPAILPASGRQDVEKENRESRSPEAAVEISTPIDTSEANTNHRGQETQPDIPEDCEYEVDVSGDNTQTDGNFYTLERNRPTGPQKVSTPTAEIREKKPFISLKQESYIITLSDSSDDEDKPPLQNVQKELAEKEMQIKRINDLILAKSRQKSANSSTESLVAPALSESEIEILKKAVSVHETELKLAETSKGTLEKQIEASNEKIVIHETSLKKTQARISELEVELGKLKRDCAARELAIGENKKIRDEARERLCEVDRQIGRVTESIREKREEMERKSMCSLMQVKRGQRVERSHQPNERMTIYRCR